MLGWDSLPVPVQLEMRLHLLSEEAREARERVWDDEKWTRLTDQQNHAPQHDTSVQSLHGSGAVGGTVPHSVDVPEFFPFTDRVVDIPVVTQRAV